MNTDNLDNDPKLAAAGRAVANLSRPAAPADLVSRTLAALAAQVPLRRTIWFLRPITSPLARIAAAAGIMMALVPLSDLDTAQSLGEKLEAKVVGPAMVDHVQGLLDDVLPHVSREDYTQSEIEQYIYVPNSAHYIGRVRPVKLIRAHSHV